MGAKFSGGGATVFHDRTDTPGEIVTELVNASDGAGLHFNGTSGNIGFTPTALGTAFSFEFIIQADSIPASDYAYIVDFGRLEAGSGRFAIASIDGVLAIYDTDERLFAGVTFLADLKVHHLVVTVDGTSAIAYDNGNQVGVASLGATSNIDSCTDAKIGSRFDGSPFFNGTIYRARFWNKTLSSTDVTSVYESASINFADQWGSQTDLINATSSGSGTAWTGASGTTPPTGWTAGGTGRTFTIDSSSGSGAEPALKITAGSSNAFIKSNLTTSKGKRYVLEFIYKNTAGDIAQYSVDAASTLVDLASSTSWSSVQSVEFTGTGGNDLYFLAKSAGDIVWFDTVDIREIGCAFDLDLAYANPTQSTIVQNRSGSGDGTAAGGVSQISPIEAVNTNKLNVSGTTPRVGIGLDAAVTPSSTLHVKSGSAGTITAQAFADDLIIENNDHVGLSLRCPDDKDGFILFQSPSATNDRVARISAEYNGGSEKLKFDVDDATRLTIDSAGTVNINGPSQDLGRLMIADNAEATRSQLALISTVTTAAANVKADITFAIPVTAASANASGLCRIFGAKENASSGNVAGYLSFETRPEGGSLTESLRIDSAGNVGLGVVPETTHATRSVMQIGGNGGFSATKAQNHTGYFDISQNAYINSSGEWAYISTDEASLYRQVSGEHLFYVAASGTADEDISAHGGFSLGAKITNAGLASFSAGIAFSGQTDASGTGITSGATTLNHYEEGTFTPSLGGNTTYHTQTGEYTRVGRLVHIRLTIFVNAIGTGSTFQISGLPFDAGGSGVGPSVSVGYATLMAVSPVSVSGYVNAGGSTIKMAGLTSAGASYTAGLAVFGDGTTMNIAASYYV